MKRSQSSPKILSIVAFLLLFLTTLDAAAIPFFGQRTQGTQAVALAQDGSGPGLMTGYTRDVQSGLGDFAFLARNFAGANPGDNGASPPGLIGPVINAPVGIAVPAPTPGSAALLALGGALLAWRYRAATQKK
jgi:hypothetical protein